MGRPGRHSGAGGQSARPCGAHAENRRHCEEKSVDAGGSSQALRHHTAAYQRSSAKSRLQVFPRRSSQCSHQPRPPRSRGDRSRLIPGSPARIARKPRANWTNRNNQICLFCIQLGHSTVNRVPPKPRSTTPCSELQGSQLPCVHENYQL